MIEFRTSNLELRTRNNMCAAMRCRPGARAGRAVRRDESWFVNFGMAAQSAVTSHAASEQAAGSRVDATEETMGALREVVVTNGPDASMREYELANGDLPAMMKRVHRLASKSFDQTSTRRIKLALRRRAILLMAEGVEGDGVSLARWILQGAATNHTPYGRADDLLNSCRDSLSPTPRELMSAAAARGGVKRREVHLMIAQCFEHHDMWRVAVRDKDAGINEFSRFGWRPLHFAAAVGATPTVAAMLALGANVTVTNGAGLSPLHVAIIHGSFEAAALIVQHSPAAATVRMELSDRSAFDLAIRAGNGRVGWCCRMLRALGESKHQLGTCKWRCRMGAPSAFAGRDCGIDVVRHVGPEDVMRENILIGRPVLIPSRHALPKVLRDGWRRRAMSRRHGDVELKLERYPYADASSSLYGDLTNMTTLRAFALSMEAGGEASGDDGDEADDVDDDVAGGEADKKAAGRAMAPVDDEANPPRSVFIALKGWRPNFITEDNKLELMFDNQSEPRTSSNRLLADWRRPPAVRHEELRPRSIQFYLGGAGAGAQPHWHGLAWNWLVHGRKRWLLWPPDSAVYSMQHVRPAVASLADAAEREPPPDAPAPVSDSDGRASPSLPPFSSLPIECIQRAGDVLIVPETWGHATINAAPWSVGWATEVALDRTFDLGISELHGNEWWRTHEAPPAGEEETSSKRRQKSERKSRRRRAKVKGAAAAPLKSEL